MVNPVYRRLEGNIKRNAALLSRRKAKFHDLQMKESGLTPKKMEQYEQKKGELREEIEFIEKELEAL